MSRVLVTIPAFNEAARIERTVELLVSRLGESGLDYRLAIAEDGSTDSTRDIVVQLGQTYPNLVIQTDSIKRGRGYSLRKLWGEQNAEVYAFLDADLSAGPQELLKVLRAIEDGADVATASRYCPGATVNRPPARSLISRFYNWTIRWTFSDSISDHQCGLKAFSRRALDIVLPACQEDSWFWDTEVLVRASTRGLRVQEVPIGWTEVKHKRTSVSRLCSDFWLHGTGFLRLTGSARSFRSEPILKVNRVRIDSQSDPHGTQGVSTAAK